MEKKQINQNDNIEVIEEGKDVASIHNQKAYTIGEKWGKETQKRNGADMKSLRAAAEVIADIRDIADVVGAYTKAGGDKATASKIKKILTLAYADAAARAIVYDESSNSLQGCYTKIRELEKGTEQINDGEGEVTEAVGAQSDDENIDVPEGVDVGGYIENINEMIKVFKFDTKTVALLKKAKERMQEMVPAGGMEWPFEVPNLGTELHA